MASQRRAGEPMTADTSGAVEWCVGSVAFERSLLVAAAEWIARAPSLPTKMALCRAVWSAVTRIRLQERALPRAEQRRALQCRLDDRTQDLVDALTAAPSAAAFLLALGTIVAPAAASAYGHVALRAEHDARAAARRVARSHHRFAARRRRARRHPCDRRELAYCANVARLSPAIATLTPGTPIASDPCAPARTPVTCPNREHTIRALRPGEMRLENWMVRSRCDIQQYLHQMIGFEIAAFESVSRQIADFPDMPWEFQRDMAAQIRDELAHLEMWLDRLPHYEGRLGQFPLSAFEFDVSAGSSLSGRLAVLQRIMEGFALEALELNRVLWESRDDDVMVTYVTRVQRDEVVHVRQGNKWLRWVCGLDAELDTVADAAQLAARERLLHAASALEASGVVEAQNLELLRLKFDQARAFPVNVPLRRRAGFSAEEIRREQDRRHASANH
jgi:uncharacterized ferritin-like protein (DUF455 family)